MFYGSVRLSMFGSDGNAVSKNGFYKDGKPHPRFLWNIPKNSKADTLREKKSKLSLEEAIYKMTRISSLEIRIKTKRRNPKKKLHCRYLTIFNPEKEVIDKATFMNPHQ